MKTRERENERRNSIIVIILILLLGLICIILASGWAVRFAPRWKLNTNMGSNLNPNSEFLTSRPVGFIEPLDPAILTNPAWIDVFLTPGASFETRIPQSTSTATATLVPVKTNTPIPSTVVSPTRTLVVTVVIPTITRTSVPPPPSTVTPNPSPTNTTVPPIPSADLQVTKTDGVTAYIPGGPPLMYTITVRNIGPASVVGARVTDAKPSQVTTWMWGCTSQNGGATGCDGAASNSANFTDTVNLPSGAWIVYTVMANTSASATGSLVNTANVALPVSPVYNDPIPGNNSATDTDTQNLPSADLEITKTDGVATYTPGGTTSLTYTITVMNNSLTPVTGAVVTDAKPAQITTWTWGCTSQTGGATGCDIATNSSVDFTDTVNLPGGSSIVYTVTANISVAATGDLVNTANVAIPATYNDPNLSNNSATDTDAVNYSTDLSITKTDGSPTYLPGGLITYTIVVSNAGPSNAVGASVTDVISPEISGTTINCVASGTASCGTNDSVGNNLSYTGVNIPVGTATHFLTITVSGTVSSGKIGNLTNTANVIVGAGQNDPAPGNNSQTDVDTPAPSSDLSITKTDNATVYTANTIKTYIITVFNAGPSDAVGATVTDVFSTNPNLASASWTCSVTGAATCSNGAGDINDTINIAVGATVTYTVTANVAASPSGNLVNTASVSLATDPTPGNNSATDTDSLFVVNATPGQIGTTPDGSVYNINPGTSLTIQLGTPIVVGAGDPTYYDLVYYEVVQGSGIAMDSIIIQAGDGGNWYTILDWGNTFVNGPNANTNIAVPLATPPNSTNCLLEPDNCSIDGSFLYSSGGFATGITIDLDSVVPPGTYRYLRLICPSAPPDVDGGVEVDAIEVLPP